MDESTVIGQLGGTKNPIRITLSEVEGARIVDIRRYYRDRTTSELKPTTKGLAVAGGNFHELISMLSDHQAQISSWLDGSGDSNARDAAKRRSATVSARTAKQGRSTVELDQWRGPSFFEVKHEGAECRICLNQAHPFVQAVEQSSDTKSALALLRDLLWAFDAACVASETDDAGRLLDRMQLQTAWGLMLGQVIKSRGSEK